MKKNIWKKSLLIVIGVCAVLTSYFTLKKEHISIYANNKKIVVNSYGKTVKDILKENKIIYDKDDIINPKVNTELKDNMKIIVTEIKEIEVTEHRRIPYKTKIKKDSSVKKGVTVIAQKGKDGKKTNIYKEVYYDNKLVSRSLQKEIIREKRVNKIVKKGTKVYRNNSKLAMSSNSKFKKGRINGNQITVSATAYSGDTITATGTTPRWGVIAVDPHVIPYGTRVYIPEFNQTFTAEDCGGGIKGNRIDIFMGSEASCYSWGVRSINIYIL